MKLAPQCVPCTLGKVVRFVLEKTGDPQKAREAVEKFLEIAGEDGVWEGSPMDLATKAYREVRRIIGDEDFLRDEKLRQNRLALAALERLKAWVEAQPEPLKGALLLSVVGNVIDLGAKPDYDLEETLGQTLERGFFVDHWELLASRLESAKTLLLVADNAGEIVFDLYFLSLVRGPEKFLSVRTRPYLNDVTPRDLEGLPYLDGVKVVTPGSDTLGIVLSEASEEYKNLFFSADVVLAKGQANLESLDGCGREVFYALMVKCDVISAFLGVPKDSAVLVLR